MTYLTPDFIALRAEADHYAKQHPLTQGAGFVRGRGFRGEHIPMLTAAPVPPLLVKDYNPRVLGPTNGPNAVTISPWDEAYRDDPRGPGAFIDMTQRDPLAGIFPGSLPRSMHGLGAGTPLMPMNVMLTWAPGATDQRKQEIMTATGISPSGASFGAFSSFTGSSYDGSIGLYGRLSQYPEVTNLSVTAPVTTATFPTPVQVFNAANALRPPSVTQQAMAAMSSPAAAPSRAPWLVGGGIALTGIALLLWLKRR